MNKEKNLILKNPTKEIEGFDLQEKIDETLEGFFTTNYSTPSSSKDLLHIRELYSKKLKKIYKKITKLKEKLSEEEGDEKNPVIAVLKKQIEKQEEKVIETKMHYTLDTGKDAMGDLANELGIHINPEECGEIAKLWTKADSHLDQNLDPEKSEKAVKETIENIEKVYNLLESKTKADSDNLLSNLDGLPDLMSAFLKLFVEST